MEDEAILLQTGLQWLSSFDSAVLQHSEVQASPGGNHKLNYSPEILDFLRCRTVIAHVGYILTLVPEWSVRYHEQVLGVVVGFPCGRPRLLPVLVWTLSRYLQFAAPRCPKYWPRFPM